MTQEELDALMSGDLDLDDVQENEPKTEEVSKDQEDSQYGEIVDGIKSNDYTPSPNIAWPPPPPNKEHKVVHQLDDVTRDSEEKATEMIDKLESIGGNFSDSEKMIKEVNLGVDRNIEIFTTLKEKFPHVKTFEEILEANLEIKKKNSQIIENLQIGQDEVMMAMDAMQYQDIHRQKIERVINVMRALSRYMNCLFEGRIDDKKRVGSAVHIEGDTTTDVVSNDDIEALIASLGKK
ncbi:chemotaxis protein [Campylobacter sp. US33a]|uniref:chemotaxis protein n=1 Tax=Campylobacter sp. US33a TaxID=2498120 RepID=UPI001068996E|nr:chemotaxis protein [Campylobacter sp. US33a]TEY01541.1 chemotaxis protein [Campylobacter sp. US33a]